MKAKALLILISLIPALTLPLTAEEPKDVIITDPALLKGVGQGEAIGLWVAVKPDVFLDEQELHAHAAYCMTKAGLYTCPPGLLSSKPSVLITFKSVPSMGSEVFLATFNCRMTVKARGEERFLLVDVFNQAVVGSGKTLGELQTAAKQIISDMVSDFKSQVESDNRRQ